MKFGVMSFNTEYTIRADELAKAAEERGLESVWFPEHTHIPASRRTPYPGGGQLPREYIHMSDPFASVAAAAAVTQKILLRGGHLQRKYIHLPNPLASGPPAAAVTKLFLLGTFFCLVAQREPLALDK